MELCLGTVQFGLQYGIQNNDKPTKGQVFEILDFALSNNIKSFDTACAYGESEKILGEWLENINQLRPQLSIVSKTPVDCLDNIKENQYYAYLKNCIESSLDRLRTNYLDTYLFHSSKYVDNDEAIYAMEQLVADGYVKQIGISLNHTNEVNIFLQKDKFTAVQFPYNIFDRRFNKIIENKKTNQTIYCRSVFLQGLLLMDEENIPPNLNKAKQLIKKFITISHDFGISRQALAMSFVKKRQSTVDYLLFGVDNLNHLKEQINNFDVNISDEQYKILDNSFQNIDDYIVSPYMWKGKI